MRLKEGIEMKLIIGLGNYGKEYSNTRHNIGFMALDFYAKKNNLAIDNCIASNEEITPRILPNVLSLTYQNVYDQFETAKKFSCEEIENILKELEKGYKYGIILRAKGIVDSIDGEWIYFDYIPEETDVRRGNADVIGKICVIGSHINKEEISELFK